jgi:uncharacterized protein (TIGR01319 family)
MNYLTVDFGSTYTKLTAVNAETCSVLGTAAAFTTIETDIKHGFDKAFKKLKSELGGFEYDELLCCSSAGGGLKMVALGLVPELTSKAAKMAASNAGAKVVKTYAYEISSAEQQEIYDINPDLALLCGGTDGGNKDAVINNAKLLKEIKRNFSIIYAGNKSAARDIDAILKDSGKDYVITKNVMPVFNELDIEPAKNAIRNLFIKKIIAAKGLTQMQKMSGGEIIPTPLAVLKACELLSLGTKQTAGIGEFIAVDLGGATTDVYSMAKGEPALENILPKGLPEPYSKRTVEGDLGMRYSLPSLTEQVDIECLASEIKISAEEIQKWIALCKASPDLISAHNSKERRIDEALAKCALEIALKRHGGTLEKVYTPMGEYFTLTGKDLTRVQHLIGIGGIIIHSKNPTDILCGCQYGAKNVNFMLPKNLDYMLDGRYIFSSMGLISSVNPELALEIMKKEIKPALRED